MSLRILIIEDIPDNRMLMRRILKAEGYNVIEAESGGEGIRLALEEVPDLILLDINMPDIDGLEICRRLRGYSILDRVPIIAVTANIMMIKDLEFRLSAGFDGYISKPIDIDAFAKQVEWHLNRAFERSEHSIEIPDGTTEEGVRHPRILYVEDNFQNLRMVRKILTRRGYEVLEATDGLTGVEMALEKLPDLIITDSELPGIDGIEVMRRIRSYERTRLTPIILTTANAKRGDRERYLAAGADGYLPKPIMNSDLLTIIEQFGVIPGMKRFPPSGVVSPQVEGWHKRLLALELVPVESMQKDPTPQEILSPLMNLPEQSWAAYLASQIAYPGTENCALAVVAMAFWQKQESGLFSRTEGQQGFWHFVRHNWIGMARDNEEDDFDTLQQWRELAPVAFALLYPVEQIPRTLNRCLQLASAECRCWALRILGDNRVVQAANVVMQSLNDENDNVRSMAISVLAKLDNPAHVPLLAHYLNDPVFGVRESSAQALAHCDGDMAQVALLMAVEHGSPEAAEVAAAALANVRIPDVIETLIRASQERTERRVLFQLEYALGQHIKGNYYVDRCISARNQLRHRLGL